MKLKAPNFVKADFDYITPEKIYEAILTDPTDEHSTYTITCDEGLTIRVVIDGSSHTYGLPWEIVE